MRDTQEIEFSKGSCPSTEWNTSRLFDFDALFLISVLFCFRSSTQSQYALFRSSTFGNDLFVMCAVHDWSSAFPKRTMPCKWKPSIGRRDTKSVIAIESSFIETKNGYPIEETILSREFSRMNVQCPTREKSFLVSQVMQPKP